MVASGAYLALTASLLWDPSGTRNASKSGKQGRIRGVASRELALWLMSVEQHDEEGSGTS